MFLPLSHISAFGSVTPFLMGSFLAEALGPGTCLSGGGRGGGGPGGRGPPPPVGTYLVHMEQKIYWATNHSAHGNAILLVANKAKSSLQVNSGFPHLIKTQQIQQSGTFTISCQLTVIMVNQN